MYDNANPITERVVEELPQIKKHRILPDYLGFSFVNNADQVGQLRLLLNKLGIRARIVSKVETPLAINKIQGIVQSSDGVMLANETSSHPRACVNAEIILHTIAWLITRSSSLRLEEYPSWNEAKSKFDRLRAAGKSFVFDAYGPWEGTWRHRGSE